MNPGKYRKKSVFSIACSLTAVLVVLMIGSALAAVLVQGFSHLGEALSSEEVLFSVGLSLKTSLISTGVCMLLAVPTAWALTHTEFPLRSAVEVLLELTMCLPYLVLGLCLLLVFSSPFGKWLKSLGFRVVFDQRGIIIAQLFVNLPFAIRLVRTAFAQVDRRLELIAGMLGASELRVLSTVTLPLCRNSLISTLILVWSRAIGEFGGTLMLVGVTRMKTETLPGCIYLNISTGDNQTALAAALIMIMIAGTVLALSNLLNRAPGYYRISGRNAG